MAFSICFITDLSQGTTRSVRASSTETLASWVMGVRVPYASGFTASSNAGVARPVRMPANSRVSHSSVSLMFVESLEKSYAYKSVANLMRARLPENQQQVLADEFERRRALVQYRQESVEVAQQERKRLRPVPLPRRMHLPRKALYQTDELGARGLLLLVPCRTWPYRAASRCISCGLQHRARGTRASPPSLPRL